MMKGKQTAGRKKDEKHENWWEEEWKLGRLVGRRMKDRQTSRKKDER